MSQQKDSRTGCIIAASIIGALLVAMIGLGIYFFMTVRDVVADMMPTGDIVEEIRLLDETYFFEPPADGLLHKEQVQRYIAVKERFAERLAEIHEKVRRLETDTADESFDIGQLTEAFGILAAARGQFLSALADQQMSPREYLYLTREIYVRYLGLRLLPIAKEVEAAMEEIPQENIDLLAQYRQALEALDTTGLELMGIVELIR